MSETSDEGFTEIQRRSVQSIREKFGDVWAERLAETYHYAWHPAIIIGFQFALAEVAEGHTEHAERFWEALALAQQCAGERLGDALIQAALNPEEGSS